MSINLVQFNMNHCWGAHNLLQQFIRERSIDIAMVTEPIYIPGKNWLASRNKGSAIYWTPNINCRVREVVVEDEFVAIEVKNIVLVSCYIPPSVDLSKFSEILRKLETKVKTLERRKQIVLGGDFNAHAMMWGSKYTSCKGVKLINCMEAVNLTLINEGNSPTCVRQQGSSIVDLTWATPQIAGRINNWKVEEEVVSLSDHNYLTFRIDLGR